MIYLRVNMIWSSCKDDTKDIIVVYVSEGFLTLFPDVCFDFFCFRIGSLNSIFYFVFGNIIVLLHLPVESCHESSFVIQSHKWSYEEDRVIL